MNDDLLPQFEPPEREPPKWVYRFWTIGFLVLIVIYLVLAIEFNIQ